MNQELVELISQPHGSAISEIKKSFGSGQKLKKRDWVFRIKVALIDAESVIKTKPVIGFIAAQRARWILNNSEIQSSDFDLISEKEYLSECHKLHALLYQETSGLITVDQKAEIDGGFTAQEVVLKATPELRLIAELEVTPTGKRMVELYNGAERIETKQGTPVLPFVLAGVCGFVGIVAGPIGCLLGLIGGGLFGVVLSAQKAVDTQGPDEKLDTNALSRIELLKSEKCKVLLGEVGINPESFLRNPAGSKSLVDSVFKRSELFDRILDQNAA
jgi:hypothetical protein